MVLPCTPSRSGVSQSDREEAHVEAWLESRSLGIWRPLSITHFPLEPVCVDCGSSPCVFLHNGLLLLPRSTTILPSNDFSVASCDQPLSHPSWGLCVVCFLTDIEESAHRSTQSEASSAALEDPLDSTAAPIMALDLVVTLSKPLPSGSLGQLSALGWLLLRQDEAQRCH